MSYDFEFHADAAVSPYLHSFAEKAAERRKAAEARRDTVVETVKPYVATVTNQANEAVEAVETVVADLRARADARAAFATDTVSPVVTEIRDRADKAVADVRKAVGL